MVEGSPAADAGLRAEDLIVSVDRIPVRGIDELLRLMTAERIGETVRLSALRAGAELEIELVPMELDG